MVRDFLMICLVAVLVLGGCTESPVVLEEGDAGVDIDARGEGDSADGSTNDSGGDVEADVEGEASQDVSPVEGPGTPIGTFENTYYYLAEEEAHSGAPEATLYDSSCEAIAVVSSSFANAACIEGTALLADGRVINYFQPCSCGGPCTYCWSVMDPDEFAWGMGSQANPLEPLRSWAVDTDLIAYGTVLYVEEWDGMVIPEVGELGGEPHDGCFRADDVGGAIQGFHVDIFAGSRDMWQALEGIFPTRTEFVVYEDSPRCEHL